MFQNSKHLFSRLSDTFQKTLVHTIHHPNVESVLNFGRCTILSTPFRLQAFGKRRRVFLSVSF